MSDQDKGPVWLQGPHIDRDPAKWENMMTFPFVKSAVEAEELTIHGLWNDIGNGELLCYDPKSGQFEPV